MLRIFLPTLIAIGLFFTAIWGLILPSFEQTLLTRKRELTNSAWSILAFYQRSEQNGQLTRQEAQTLAAAQIQALRYGPESKDYFWIQDLSPRMVMHPYRPDLNGQDLSTFADARGQPIFVAFAQLVQMQGEGYIDYVWQWNDDPTRLAPKESYVKGFEPWGWIIGTGLYTDDVRAEILRLERSLVNTSLAISGAVVFLLVFVLQQSLRIERERQEALDTLRESTDRYHALIEATTEGTLLILEERCRYANPTFLTTVGCTARQLEFLDLTDVLPRVPENRALWERIANPQSESGIAAAEVYEGVLRHLEGRVLPCVLTLHPMFVSGQRGIILLARAVTQAEGAANMLNLAYAAQAVPLGLFRAASVRPAPVLDYNTAARAFFETSPPTLEELFPTPEEFTRLPQTVLNGEPVQNYLIHQPAHPQGARVLALALQATTNPENPSSPWLTGTLQDVTTQHAQATNRESLIEKLQTSLLFLHEPLSQLGRDALVCDLHTPIGSAAQQMTARNLTAALVSSGSDIIGIVTDHDLRARVLTKALPLSAPLHTIMSAPLSKIPEDARIYEALMQMEEKGVRHLAVEDQNGQVVSVIDNKALIQFQRYGAIVLTRELTRANSVNMVAQLTARTPPLASALLKSSARPRPFTHMLSAVCDAATERLVQLAIQELGTPPAEFAFVAMGSHRRSTRNY